MPDTVETLRSFPSPSETLAVLETAIRRAPAASSRRIFATDDSRSAEEGLAILRCYVSIVDRNVRQAILDALVIATDVDPRA